MAQKPKQTMVGHFPYRLDRPFLSKWVVFNQNNQEIEPDSMPIDKGLAVRRTANWPLILSLSVAPVFIAFGGFASQWLVNSQSIRAPCIQTNLNVGTHHAIGEGKRLIVIAGWEEFMYKSKTCVWERNVEKNTEVIERSDPIPSMTLSPAFACLWIYWNTHC